MKRYRWNARKCVGNVLALLTVLGFNAIVCWMLIRWVTLGGAA